MTVRTGFSTITLRGGRMIKWKGRAASLSPMLGQLATTVSSAALATAAVVAAPALLFAASPAHAACTPLGGGAFDCTTSETTQQTLTATGVILDVDVDQTITFDTTTSGFPFGNAFVLLGDSGIDFQQDAPGGSITGRYYGIYARDSGNGAIAITTTGSVIGDTIGAGTYDGINAATTAGASLSITTIGTVYGGRNAINAVHNGTASLSGDSLTIDAQAAVTGAGDAIVAINNGTGTLSITTANVSGDFALVPDGVGSGIVATNATTANDLTIVANGAVSGGNYGIVATNNGGGALSITTVGVTGDIFGNGTGGGIYAYNSTVAGTTLGIAATGSVTGGYHGINAVNVGTGSLTITADGTVTGDSDGNGAGYGIRAINTTSGGVTISTAAVNGGNTGISASNLAAGDALSVTTTGAVDGDTDGDGVGYGISAINSGTTLTVDAGAAVSGGYHGIVATNNGSGALSITTGTGAVTGDAENDGLGLGIYAVNSGTSLSIDAGGAVSGGSTAIYGLNNGSGALSIMTSGTVTGDTFGDGTGNGVAAVNGVGGTDLTIVAADEVRAGSSAVSVVNNGTGSISITSGSGALVGDTNDDGTGVGIFAQNAGDGLSIDAGGDVSGGASAIYARNNGTGTLSIDTAATSIVTGDTAGDGIGDGINAVNAATAEDLTIVALGATTGGQNGIFADNQGSGDLSITSANATGNDGNGIGAINAGGDLAIDASGAVSGSTNGISVDNQGSGALSIAADMASGSGGYGIGASNTGTDLTITTGGAISGSDNAISAANNGSGALSITTTGTVTGDSDGDDSGSGIAVVNDGTDLVIEVQGPVTGGYAGIYADNNGSGTLSVTTGSGPVSGGTGVGIFVSDDGSGIVLDIQGEVTGGLAGIFAETSGSDADVTIGAVVTGGNTRAIELVGIAGATRLELQPGWDTIGETVADGAGNLLVFGGDGESAFDLGDFATAAEVPDFAGNEFFGFEPILAKEGSSTFTITDDLGAGPAFTTADIADGTLILDDATLTMAGGATPFTIAANGILAVNGVSAIMGDLTNGNVIDLSSTNLATGTVLSISGNYVAASDLILDVDLSYGGGADNMPGTDAPFADQLLIGGNATGITNIVINNIAAVGTESGTGDNNGNGLLDPDEGILLVQVLGTADAEAIDGVTTRNPNNFVLANGPIVAGAFEYDLVVFDPDESESGGFDYALVSAIDPMVTPMPPSGPNFQDAAPVYEALTATLLSMNTLPTFQQRIGSRHWAGGAASAGGEITSGFWIRGAASFGDFKPDRSTTATDYDVDRYELQSGVDTVLSQTDSGALIGGLTAHYSTASAEVTSFFGTGDIDHSGFGVGATLSWLGQTGFYVDTQFRYSWYQSDLRSDAFGRLATDNDASGIAGAIELGHSISVGERFTVTPQAQISYSAISFDSFVGPNGENVSDDEGDSLIGRLGFSVDSRRSWESADGSVSSSHIYGIANIHYEFLDENSVRVATTQLISNPGSWTGEVGLGGSYSWNDGGLAIFGELSYANGFDDDGQRLGANIGLRVGW
ncbi:MAG: autotransporter outer membrane beta-barrel domain-containing protein [Pseudomonadota bacterium]